MRREKNVDHQKKTLFRNGCHFKILWYAFILAQLTSDDPRLVGLILISVTEEFLIGSHHKLGRNYTQYKIPRIAKTCFVPVNLQQNAHYIQLGALNLDLKVNS